MAEVIYPVLLAGLVANQVIQMVSEWLPIGETANQVLLNQSLFQTSYQTDSCICYLKSIFGRTCHAWVSDAIYLA